MNRLRPSTHPLVMTRAHRDRPEGAGGDASGFKAIYDAWFHEVCRWLRASGIPERELEDVAQDVFLVVRRKLDGFDGRNLGGWLYRLSCNTASDRRRRAWFLRLVLRAPDDAELDAVDDETPAILLERREAHRLVMRVMDRLRGPHRRALGLYEIEGYSVAEIAALEGVPAATVKTRLFHARKRFRQQLVIIAPEFDEP